MNQSRSDGNAIETQRQRLHDLEREEGVERETRKELEGLLEEHDLNVLNGNPDWDSNSAMLQQKVQILISNLLEQTQIDDEDLDRLRDSIEAIEQQIAREQVPLPMTRKENDAMIDKLKCMLKPLKMEQEELASIGDTLALKISDLEKKLSLKRDGSGKTRQDIRILKEKIRRLEDENEELAGEEVIVQTEIMLKMSKADAYERGNGLFSELHDRKVDVMRKIEKLKIKIEGARLELETKKNELQLKKVAYQENRGKSHVFFNKTKNEYLAKIEEHKESSIELLYKLNEPRCQYPDSLCNDFAWVEQALGDASRQELKALRECETSLLNVLELTENIAEAEEEVNSLHRECLMLEHES